MDVLGFVCFLLPTQNPKAPKSATHKRFRRPLCDYSMPTSAIKQDDENCRVARNNRIRHQLMPPSREVLTLHKSTSTKNPARPSYLTTRTVYPFGVRTGQHCLSIISPNRQNPGRQFETITARLRFSQSVFMRDLSRYTVVVTGQPPSPEHASCCFEHSSFLTSTQLLNCFLTWATWPG